MKRVDIVYRCIEGASRMRTRPRDPDEALRRLNQGNLTFASLFTGADAEDGEIRHEIDVDLHDLGLLASTDAPLRQVPFAAILGCADARFRSNWSSTRARTTCSSCASPATRSATTSRQPQIRRRTSEARSEADRRARA